MATLFSHRAALPAFTLLTSGLTTYTLLRSSYNRPLLCDSFFSPSSFLPFAFRRTPPPPPPTDYRGFNPIVYRQTATGSFLGVACGLLISKFGRTIAIIVGALLVGVEMLARKGVEVVNWEAVGRWAGGWVDVGRVRRWAGENMAFKIAFMASFGLATIYI